MRNRAREVDTRSRMTADLHRGGAGILAGTVAALAFLLVMLGNSVHEELALLVRAGLTPLQALQAAMLNPARFLNATESLGTVAGEKVTDLVLLDTNPLADIRSTSRIQSHAEWPLGRPCGASFAATACASRRQSSTVKTIGQSRGGRLSALWIAKGVSDDQCQSATSFPF